MPPRPADLYLALHDDGPVLAATSPARRLAALLFAVLLLAAVPLVWADNAVATAGPKAAIAHDDDNDNSGPGGGDDDEPTGTATNSNTATRTGDTGASTKQPTATQSNTATKTGKTGVSTKQPTATQSNTATRTGKTGASTKG